MTRSLFTAGLFTALLASSAAAGPPWISVEMPANPHHPSTRDAAMLIRTYHHSTSIEVPVNGVAQGIVDGRRVSMPLDIRRTNIAGVYAVHTELPRNGSWVLAVTLTQGPNATATALVSVDARGRVVAVDVPSNRSRDGWRVPRPVQAADIDAALRAVAADDRPTAGGVGYAGVLALPLLLLGGLAVRRGRR